MSKLLLIIGVILLTFTACSDKEEELKPEKKVEIKKIKKIENNETKIDINTTKENMMVIKEEFIPEHIKNSHIEVVEHY